MHIKGKTPKFNSYGSHHCNVANMIKWNNDPSILTMTFVAVTEGYHCQILGNAVTVVNGIQLTPISEGQTQIPSDVIPADTLACRSVSSPNESIWLQQYTVPFMLLEISEFYKLQTLFSLIGGRKQNKTGMGLFLMFD